MITRELSGVRVRSWRQRMERFHVSGGWDGAGMLGGGHFRERDLEREGGFGTLVFVGAVVVQAVAAAAGGGIVKRDAEIVAAEKPVEGAPRLAPPEVIVVARKASRQAETIAWASTGCWSKSARSPFCS